LPDQLLHGLLSVGNHRRIPASLFFHLLFPAVGHIFTNSRLKEPSGKFCSTDYQSQCPIFYFLLHGLSLPSVKLAGLSASTAAPPVSGAGIFSINHISSNLVFSVIKQVTVSYFGMA